MQFAFGEKMWHTDLQTKGYKQISSKTPKFIYKDKHLQYEKYDMYRFSFGSVILVIITHLIPIYH